MPTSEGNAPSEDPVGGFPQLGEGVDSQTFGQILEMDDIDEEREFSKTLVLDYLQQAKETFEKMDAALKNQALHTLSELGHYLKGSSATLGLVKVKESCEKIQRYGKMENLDGSPEMNTSLCLKRIADTLPTLRKEFAEVERILRRFYGVEEPAAATASAT